MNQVLRDGHENLISEAANRQHGEKVHSSHFAINEIRKTVLFSSEWRTEKFLTSSFWAAQKCFVNFVDRQVTTVKFVAMLSTVSLWYQVLVAVTRNLNHVVNLTWSLSFKFLLARNINQISLPINMTVQTTWPAGYWRWYWFLTWCFAFFGDVVCVFCCQLWRWAWQPTIGLLVALTSEQSFWRNEKAQKS